MLENNLVMRIAYCVLRKNPLCVMRRAYCVKPDGMAFTHHARRNTQYAIRNTHHARRNAHDAIRTTQYARRNTNGFSLIESLVVVSIMAMILLAVYSSLSAGAGIWMRISKGMDERRLLLTWEEMQRDVRNTFSFKGIGFEGEEGGVSFPGLVLVKGNTGKMHKEVGRVRYYYDDKCQCLCHSRTAYIDLQKNEDKGENTDCQNRVAGIKNATFEYYGSGVGGQQGGYSWITKWIGARKPIAMRFKVIMMGNNEKQFVTLLP